MKKLHGTVKRVSPKTARVDVSRRWLHPLYKKSMVLTKSYLCHAEDLTLAVGDMVEIKQSRPFSKTKHFVVVRKMTS